MGSNIENEIAKALISSFGSSASELSELFADKIRFLRWKSAIRTLEKAKTFAQPYGGLTAVPPLKFFLPFMENCSLEEEDEEIVDMWAHLLVSASTHFEPGQLLFMRILKEITGEEARLLKRIATHDNGETLVPRVEDAISDWEMFSAPASPLRLIDICQDKWDETVKFVFEKLQPPGVAIHVLNLADTSGPVHEEIEEYPYIDTIAYGFDYVSFEILQSQNLIKDVEQSYVDTSQQLELYGYASCTTILGAKFLHACMETPQQKA